jgi:hypothetical protein
MTSIQSDHVYRASDVPFDLLQDWRQCPFKCLLKLLGVPGQVTERERFKRDLGRIVENAVSGDNTSGCSQLPDDELIEAQRMVSLSKQLSAQRGGSSQQQVQFSWSDPVSGYTLLAKPDEVNRLSGTEGPIIQVIDDKIGWRLTEYHRAQIKFFGLVVAMSEQHQGGIELVVRLLGTPPIDRTTGERLEIQEREPKIWFSRRQQVEYLADVRRTLRNLRMAREALERLDLDGAELSVVLKAMRPHFSPRTGPGCSRCPHRSQCPLFQSA